MNNENRKIIFLFPLLIYLISALVGCTSSQERRILVVHSYEETYTAYPEFNRLIAKQFKKEGVNADIRTLYLDCESYKEETELKRMRYLLDSVSGDWRPEVILVNEDQATYSMSCQLLPRVLSYLHIQKSRIQKCKQTDTIPKEFSGHFSILNKADLIMKARRIGILLQQLPIRIIDSGKDHRHLFH